MNSEIIDFKLNWLVCQSFFDWSPQWKQHSEQIKMSLMFLTLTSKHFFLIMFYIFMVSYTFILISITFIEIRFIPLNHFSVTTLKIFLFVFQQFFYDVSIFVLFFKKINLLRYWNTKSYMYLIIWLDVLRDKHISEKPPL